MGWHHSKETSLPIAQSSQTLCICTTTISPPFQSMHLITSQSGECKYSRGTKMQNYLQWFMLYFPTLFICCETYNVHVYWLKASMVVYLYGLAWWFQVRKVVCFSVIADTSRTIRSVTTPQIHCPTRPHWLLCKITPSALFKSN